MGGFYKAEAVLFLVLHDFSPFGQWVTEISCWSWLLIALYYFCAFFVKQQFVSLHSTYCSYRYMNYFSVQHPDSCDNSDKLHLTPSMMILVIVFAGFDALLHCNKMFVSLFTSIFFYLYFPSFGSPFALSLFREGSLFRGPTWIGCCQEW